MTISIHENSIKKIKLLIKNIVDNHKPNECNAYNYYDQENFDLIANELNKRKTEHKIDGIKCYIIFETVLNKIFKDKDIENPTTLNRFIDSVFDVYQNTPLDWRVSFHFKRLDLSHSISNFDLINLSHDRYQTFESMLRYDTYNNYSVVEIHRSGFFSGLSSDEFIKQTTQYLNILILLLSSYGVLVQDSKEFHSASLESILSGIDTKAVTIRVVSDLYPSLFSRETSLPDSMQSYYGQFVVKSNNEPEIRKALIIANSLASNNSKESLRIKSAIDWLVHSDIMEDSTMSFIQICIGLESIFGDDDYEGGLTNALSDRCAYLIGKNINDRKNIKKAFKEVYQIRSKIIHGVRNHLSEKEGYLRSVARTYLSMSIIREIDNLTN